MNTRKSIALFAVLPLLLMVNQAAAQPSATAAVYEVKSLDPLLNTIFTRARIFPQSDHPYRQINAGNGHQNSITNYAGYQYVFYISQSNFPTLARRLIGGDSWTFEDLWRPKPGTWYPLLSSAIATNDSHRQASIGISDDGRIHLAHGHIVDELKYRWSRANAASDPALGMGNNTYDFFPWAERNHLSPTLTYDPVTYPRFVSGKPNKMYMIWNQISPDGSYTDTYLSVFTSNVGWAGKWKILDGNMGAYTDPYDATVPQNQRYGVSNGRRAYLNDVRFTSDGRLHMSWTWREFPTCLNLLNTPDDDNCPGSAINHHHDLMYAYSDNNGYTWKNAAGQQIGSLNSPINLNSTGVVGVHIPYEKRLQNNGGMAANKFGDVYFLMKHNDSSNNQNYLSYSMTRGGAITGSPTWSSGIRLPATDGSGGQRLYIDPNHSTLYAVTSAKGIKIRVYAKTASQSSWISTPIYTSEKQYEASTHGVMAADGTTLSILAQRKRPSNSSETSALDVIELSLDPL